MNFKVLALGAALGFAIAVVPSCGTAKCSTANCKGCCSSDNKCVPNPSNTNNTTCGTSGGSCVDCTKTNQVCNATSFQCADTTTTGGGGGTGGGTGGGNSSTCAGCTLPSGLCLSMPTTTNCGTGGAACAPCATGQLCTNGVCATPDSGVVAGAIGSPCNSAADCVNVPLEPGFQAICKKQTIPGSNVYPGGYCTRRCLGDQSCQAGTGNADNLCMYVLGPFGERENICLKSCPGNRGSCNRDGYECIDWAPLFGEQSGMAACWILPDGGLPEWDAGVGNSAGNAGTSCTADTECGAQPEFQCLPGAFPDGGPTPFPGGLCFGDCTGAWFDGDYCGDGGICLPYLAEANGGDLVVWQCSERCNPSAANSCHRSGYVCDPRGTSTTIGTCTPDCRVTPAICGGGTCVQTTGLCQ